VRFFVDECLSPALARRLNDLGFDALHPLDVGRRGELDHTVLRRCIEEDRILITENAGDFRELVGREDMHPGLIVMPAISRAGTLRLLEVLLHFLRSQADPRDYMFNRVLEVNEDGTIHTYRLPGRSFSRD
jgi:predicted nuclease of predicted toxin-antitoxin system